MLSQQRTGRRGRDERNIIDFETLPAPFAMLSMTDIDARVNGSVRWFRLRGSPSITRLVKTENPAQAARGREPACLLCRPF